MRQKQIDTIVAMAAATALCCGFTLAFLMLGYQTAAITSFSISGTLVLLDFVLLFAFLRKRKGLSGQQDV